MEIGYSLHLGSNRNRTSSARTSAKSNLSGTSSRANNGIQNAQQLSKCDKHNYRKYDNDTENIWILKGTNSAYEDVKEFYQAYFDESKTDYNNKQTRSDRKIDDYFEYISNDQKKDLACELIIEIGDKNYWDSQSMEDKKRMADVYSKQIQDLEDLMPNFKITSAAMHLDETSPHIHIIGVPVKDKNKYGMSKQGGKSDVFTRESLAKLQDSMRELAIDEFNEEYITNYKLKKKKIGRNIDIDVKDMQDYQHIKNQLESSKQSINESIDKQQKLKSNINDIYNIMNNLESTTFFYKVSKNDKNKIDNYLKETKLLMEQNEELMKALTSYKLLLDQNNDLENENSNLRYDKDKWIKKYQKLENNYNDSIKANDFLNQVHDRDKIDLLRYMSNKINNSDNYTSKTFKDIASDMLKNKVLSKAEHQLCLKPIFSYSNAQIQSALSNINKEMNQASEEFYNINTDNIKL